MITGTVLTPNAARAIHATPAETIGTAKMTGTGVPGTGTLRGLIPTTGVPRTDETLAEQTAGNARPREATVSLRTPPVLRLLQQDLLVVTHQQGLRTAHREDVRDLNSHQR